MLLLGNDIVDLNEAGITGKFYSARFVERVFSREEKSAISLSENPDLTLWMFWAAKETAYKIISKITGPPVFSYKKFKTTFRKKISKSKSKFEVVYDARQFQIELTTNINYIHAVGAHANTSELPNYLLSEKVHQVTQSELRDWQNRNSWPEHFTKEELVSIHHAESALVRFHCKKLVAKELKIAPSRLQIIRPSKARRPQPPFLLLDNKQTEIDISLSHHGLWLGFCFSIKQGQR
ncbi:4-phosphopantetheinyl transferase family protein [candidate division KSB1 bacterium]|nr:4-phosphopantetheinyl transferase family protein [candidate division KSB1 bacterium]